LPDFLFFLKARFSLLLRAIATFIFTTHFYSICKNFEKELIFFLSLTFDAALYVWVITNLKQNIFVTIATIGAIIKPPFFFLPGGRKGIWV